jgi:hypothetical protein
VETHAGQGVSWVQVTVLIDTSFVYHFNDTGIELGWGYGCLGLYYQSIFFSALFQG